MATKNIEFRVGLVIMVGIIMIAASLYWLQGYRLQHNSRIISVRFDDVGTLAVGDRVTVSGVRRGKVSDLSLTGDGVVVDLLISRDVVLKQDARFVIKNLGLMGERFIAIKPGADTLLLDTAQIVFGQYDTGLPEVMGLMGDMILELRNLVHSFKQSVGSDSSLAKFNRTVSNLESVSESMAGFMSRNTNKLDQTAENFLKASGDLKNLVANTTPGVDSTINRFDRASAQLETLVSRLDTLSVSARKFADRLESNDGTLQALVDDRRLYDDLRQAADNLDDLINDIRANPRKYINLTVELF